MAIVYGLISEFFLRSFIIKLAIVDCLCFVETLFRGQDVWNFCWELIFAFEGGVVFHVLLYGNWFL